MLVVRYTPNPFTHLLPTVFVKLNFKLLNISLSLKFNGICEVFLVNVLHNISNRYKINVKNKKKKEFKNYCVCPQEVYKERPHVISFKICS